MNYLPKGYCKCLVWLIRFCFDFFVDVEAFAKAMQSAGDKKEKKEEDVEMKDDTKDKEWIDRIICCKWRTLLNDKHVHSP